MVIKDKPEMGAGKGRSFVKGLSFNGFEALVDGNPVVVDVQNGKIVRIKPLHYDWHYDPKNFRPWKIKARGQTFEPSMKSLIPPFSLAYKKRVYSPNRILYPLKRVDWDPDGEMIPRHLRLTYNILELNSRRAAASEGKGVVQSELERLTTPAPINPTQVIPKNLIHEAIVNAPISWYGCSTFVGTIEDQFIKHTYPAKGCSEVHMIWTDSPCWITCWNDSNSFIRALRSPKIEFMLAQHPWMENDCLFADIILPVSTKFEEHDITSDLQSGQFSIVMHGGKCIEPIGEAKSPYEAVCMVADKLGLLEQYTGGKSAEEWQKISFENSGIEDKISYEELDERGYFVIPTNPDWGKYPAGMKEFHDDPDSHPVKTVSGKIEFYSQNLAKHFPDDTERPPVPHWIEKGECHDERISSERTKKYPLLMMSNHGRWRVHAQCDDISWTREAPTGKIEGPDGYKYEPLWINPGDAAKRGIAGLRMERVLSNESLYSM